VGLWNLLFTPSDFMPHGYCYLWNPGLVWLHVVSDALIALAYFTIPVVLILFIRKRRDLPFSWMFALFGVFIVACGATHIMEVWNLWHANYWLSGVIKALTAAASVGTAILLGRLMPDAVLLPRSSEWIKANARLENEIRDHRDLELDLRTSEANYRQQAELLDLTHDAIFVRSLSSSIVYWNRGAERLYGWQREDAMRKVSYELLRTEFPIPLSQIEAQVYEKGAWEGELVHHRRDGAKIVVSSRWALQLDASNQPMRILEINRDITQRKMQEKKFRNLLESAPDAIVIVNERGQIQLVNAQTEKLFGYSREELIGQPVEILIPQRFRQGHVAHRDGYSKSPHPREMGAGSELYGRRKDGTEFPVEISLSPLETEEGMLVSSAIRDITDRKRADSKFRNLLESAPDAMVIVNQEGQIQLINTQTERLFGYSRAEVIGKPVEILIPERFQGGHVAHRHGYSQSPRPREMGAGAELYGRRKDGTEFPVEISLSPLQTEEGTLISSAIRDITDRKRAESKFRNLLESAPDAMVIVNQKGQIQLINAQTERLFGYSRGELIGKPVEILIPERFQGGHVAHRDGYSQSPRPREMGAGAELYGRRKDGTEFPVEISLSPIETEEGTFVSSAIRDVTERRQTSEQIQKLNSELSRRVAQLGIINQELETFSYSVSHDLRAPLRHIDGFARILKEECAAEISPEGLKHLDRILHAVTHMGRLVDDLLNLARIGRKELVRKTVKLDQALREAMADLPPEAKERKIDWQIEPLPEVECDSGLVKIVFMNLLTNAVKFTRSRQQASVQIGAVTKNGVLTFFVRDNGVGFDPKYADKLFGVFQRLHNQQEFEGTGVGLATVQRIVHRHGGTIWAESQPDHGATFFFTLGSRQTEQHDESTEVKLGKI
jgi:PAS domain S-box-containing protein